MLRELSDASARRAEALVGRRAELERAVADAPEVPGFAAALRRPTVAVIGEVKRRSPSKGEIAPALSAAAQSAAYAEGGAAALSILTEPLRFGGSEADVLAARSATTLPVLKKDFHVAHLQMLEARALGASAALLIARALPPAELVALARTARDAGLETLVEIRDERELETALLADATVIGVNNRNLETLVIDLTTGERLVPLIPADRVAVFESGVYGPAEVERAAAAGADAVLVGSSLSAAADPVQALRDIAGVRRRGRVPAAA